MKKYFVVFCAILQSLVSLSAVRTPEVAAQLATEFTNNRLSQTNARSLIGASVSMKLVHTFSKPLSTEPAVYAFNRGDDQGFVLVSADDLTLDILCYSDTGNFDLSTANPNFLWWIKRYTQEIANVNSENAYTGTNAARKTEGTTTTAISPLLGNIAWDQEAPYYNKCPMDLDYPDERCYTGCVATATAQIMYYWKFPLQGTGSHSYKWESWSEKDSTNLSLDFSTITFDWENMLEKYTSRLIGGKNYNDDQADAVATLMYACGVACDMQYGGETNGGSGAYTDAMGYGLMTYLGYKNTVKFLTTYSKGDYGDCSMSNVGWSQTTDELAEAFNIELEAGRPILMGGEDDDSGHEFVCDGRDTSGRFHINWGWSGDCNCYCALSSLKPKGESYNFSDQIDAIIGIEPDYTTSITGVTINQKSTSGLQKFLENGRIVILKNGHKYSLNGQLLK